MNWDPAMLELSNLETWRLVVSWALGLPMIIALFMYYVICSTLSINMTENMIADMEKGSKSLITRFAIIYIAAPLLAVIMQFCTMVAVYAFALTAMDTCADRRNRR